MELEKRNRAVLKTRSDSFVGRLFNGQDNIGGNSKRTLATRQALALMNALFG